MSCRELKKHDLRIIANISGNTPEEYGIMCVKLSEAGVDMIEVNISCPNVEGRRPPVRVVPAMAAEVTAEAKASTVPVMVKLSPMSPTSLRLPGRWRTPAPTPSPDQYPAGDAD